MKFDIRKTIREFFLNEAAKPSLESFVESLRKIFEALKPRTTQEQRLYEAAKYHLKEIKNGVRKLLEEKRILEEQVKVLEEEKSKRKK